jgi:CDP-glucose 4,6-dehydratase
VLEPLSGYLQLAERLYTEGAAFADGWNFGPDETAERPVRYLAEQITALWGEGAAWQAMPQAGAPHEAHYLTLNAGKARKALGWCPRLALDDALALTVDWYRAFGAGRDMREFSCAQINAYVAGTERVGQPA